MEQNNNSKEVKKALWLLVGIPVVAVLILLGMLIYDNYLLKKEIDQNNNSQITDKKGNSESKDDNKENSDNTYDDLKGYYEAKRNIESYDDEIKLGLDLYKDGTFLFNIAHISTTWSIAGNYSIENNIIKLNFQYAIGGDCEYTSTAGTTSLILDNNNLILNDISVIEYFEWNVDSESTKAQQIHLLKKESNNVLIESNKYDSVLDVLDDINCD